MRKLRHYLFISLLVLLCVSTVTAFHVPPWDTGHNSFSGDDGDDTDPGDDGPCKSGSPVELASGNFSYSTRDLAIPGLGPDIDLARTYNSNDMRRGPFGNGWVFPYDQRLVETTDGTLTFAICSQPNGKRERFVKQPDGSFLAPLHFTATLVKNADNTYTLRLKNGSTRRFNTDGRLVAITDRNGNAMTLAYDATGFPTTLTDAAGRSVQLTKGANGRIESIQDPAGRVFRYSYDAAGNLTRFADPLGNATTYQYDAKNNLTAIIDPRGNRVVGLTYDTQGRVATLIEAEETWTYAYQPTVRRTTKRDSSNRTWTYEYNTLGNITRRTDPLGGVEVFDFDSNSRVVGFTDKLGRRTTAVYDAMGNVASSTDPLGNVSTYTYDPTFDVPLTSRDPLGNVTRFEYDARGNLLKSTDPLNRETTFQYDAKGQLVRETDPAGNTTTHEYDAYGNLTRTTDPAGNTITNAYDLLGKLVSMTDREGRTGRFFYDDAQRLIRTTDAQGLSTTNEYDASGNLVAVTVPGGARTVYQYDNFNRRVRATNSLNQVTTFTYDRKSNLLSRTDPRGVTIGFTYDALSRPLTRSRPGDQVVYTYDRVGNLLTMTDGDSGLTMVYDALGRITEARTSATAGQPATTVRYTYDANGNRRTMTDPSGGVTNYTYDALLRLAVITEPAGRTYNFGYDTLSQRTRLTRSSGLTTTYTYDAVSRPVSVTHQSAAGTQAFITVYDRIGNRVGLTDPAGTHTYSYDSLYRLLGAGHPAGGAPAESYAYDGTGNRTASHLSATYAYDTANRLTADAVYDYVYDANGNLTRKTERATGGVTAYTYDAENQLTNISFPNGTAASYRYDGIGRRIEKNVNGQITRYVYDGMDILAEYSATGTLNARYVNGPELDEVLAVRRGGTTYDLELDPLGSTARVTDGANVSASYSYDSFGRIVSQTGSSVAPHGFQGREFDAESGLYYFRARYYDPQLGRFVSEDPLRFAGGINFYQFARNNPLNLFDPMGTDVGFWESMIPIWGSGKQAYEDFKCGRWGWGLFNTAMAISDVFLVKSLVTGIAKGAFKTAGSHSWKATRQWLNQTGRVEYKGQHFHHWLFERNQGIGQHVPDVIKNQPWNLMGLPGTDNATSNAFHQWLHHHANPAQRLWYGTPAWAKAVGASSGGRAANAARGNENCECP